MKLGGILRLLITACLAMAMLAAPQARAHLVPTMSPHGKFAVAMTQVGTQPMDCCPNKHMPAPRTCPECPLMAMCSSPYLDQVRTAEIVRPIRQVLARVMPEDEREGGDHAPSPLRKPPRSQG